MIKTFHETKRYTDDSDYFYIKNESYMVPVNQVYFGKYNNIQANFQYSYDKINWLSVPNNTPINLRQNQKVYFRSNTPISTSSSYYWYMSDARGIFSIGGNLATLIDYTDVANLTTIPDYAFYRMFERTNLNNKIVDASKLTTGNLTTVGKNAFYETFKNCESLKYSPDFSSITTIDDSGMEKCFQKCNIQNKINFSSLTTVGQNAFNNCFYESYITKSPDFSSLTTVGNSAFYGAFTYCYYLTKSPDFSSLTTVGDSAFASAYIGCYNLSEVTAPNVNTWNTDVFSYWLNSAGSWVTTTKTFYAPTGLSIPTDSQSGIPTGWTRVDY